MGSGGRGDLPKDSRGGPGRATLHPQHTDLLCTPCPSHARPRQPGRHLAGCWASAHISRFLISAARRRCVQGNRCLKPCTPQLLSKRLADEAGLRAEGQQEHQEGQREVCHGGPRGPRVNAARSQQQQGCSGPQALAVSRPRARRWAHTRSPTRTAPPVRLAHSSHTGRSADPSPPP